MTPEERQRHLQVLPWILERLLERDTRHTGALLEAVRVAFAALEREGQMEERLRSFMLQAFDMDKVRTDPSTAQYFIGVDDFTGFCSVIDSGILEVSNG